MADEELEPIENEETEEPTEPETEVNQLLTDVKQCLRIYSDDEDAEIELQDLIDAAKADLQLSGVLASKIIETDPLIKRAITLYCKAEYGYDEMGKHFALSYKSLKNHLTLSAEYTVGD